METLHEAAIVDDRETAELELAAGTAVDAAGYDGRTPLMVAARSDSAAVLQLLIAHGAKVGAEDDRLWTALTHSAIYRSSECEALLRAAGAEPTLRHAVVMDDYDLLVSMLPTCRDVDRRDALGRTHLVAAAETSSSAIAGALIAAGVDVNARGNAGESALGIATSRRKEDMAALLIRSGAHPEAVDEFGRPALVSAAQHCGLETSELLLAAGPGLNSVDRYGRTALMWAAGRGNVELLRLLRDRSANPDIPDSEGETAMSWGKEYPAILEVLSSYRGNGS